MAGHPGGLRPPVVRAVATGFGKGLYRDVAYLSGGPLSQYFHALIFKLFGVSFLALVITNLALLALFIGLLYFLFARAAGRWTAFMACLVTLCAFSFSQYVQTGNYNFVCPYVYDTTHGLMLSTVAIALLCRWLEARPGWLAFATGLCTGGVFLTKPEIFLALAAALAVGGVVAHGREKIRLPTAGCFLAGALLPPVFFVGYFTAVWQFTAGVKAVVWAWLPMFTSSVTRLGFFQWCLGLDAPAANLTAMGERFGGFVLTVVLLVLVSRGVQGLKLAVRLALGVLVLGLVFRAVPGTQWLQNGFALTPITFLVCGFLFWKWWQNRRDTSSERLIFPLVWSVFALFLLAKMGLRPRIWHYGFYQGLPATLLVVFLVLRLLPDELRRFQIDCATFRILATAIMLAGLGQLLKGADFYYSAKDYSVGDGADRIITYNPRVAFSGYALQSNLPWLRENLPPSATLAAVPEGNLINYLARLRNPVSYSNLAPPEMEVYGQANIVRAFIQNPPDYILLVHQEIPQGETGYFGQEPGYGRDLMRWIGAHYSPVWLFGSEPLQTNAYGLKLLRRKNQSIIRSNLSQAAPANVE